MLAMVLQVPSALSGMSHSAVSVATYSSPSASCAFSGRHVETLAPRQCGSGRIALRLDKEVLGEQCCRASRSGDAERAASLSYSPQASSRVPKVHFRNPFSICLFCRVTQFVFLTR